VLSSFRILVVDDYEAWRRQACLLLQAHSELRVIGEASDGSEAVQKAKELRPDLILLDIRLPKLNGLEAARKIRKVAPESKILFLTQESSADVAQEALSLGALGYVVKAHAGTELLAAVRAVLQGTQFVSSGLSGHYVANAADARVPDRPYYKEGLARTGSREKEITRHHEVQFHSDDASLLAGFASFIEAGLKAGNAVIVVATGSHRESLLLRLQAKGVDVATAIGEGRYISLDVAEALSTFMVKDLPDPVRFFKIAGNLMVEAAKATKGKHSRIWACGECAPTLYAQGKVDAAIQVEHFWDEIAKTYNVDILCGYILETIDRQPNSNIYWRICAKHSAVQSH
jgi:DNA-binding NarL/FixJ family response regulator